MTRKKNAKGFTLIEIVVVIAIVAVLIALVAPLMMRYIQTAQTLACANNRATLKKQLYLEQVFDVKTEQELQKLAVDSDIHCPLKKGSYTVALTDGTIVVTCSIHGNTSGGQFGMGDGVPAFNFSPALSAAVNNLASLGTRVDSTSTKGKNTQSINAYFKAMGLDPTKSNVQSWAVINEKTQNVFYWSEIDISSSKAGDKVLALRYNDDKKTYTAGYLTVMSYTENGETYNVFNHNSWKEYKADGVTQSNQDKQEFSTIKNYYDQAKASGT